MRKQGDRREYYLPVRLTDRLVFAYACFCPAAGRGAGPKCRRPPNEAKAYICTVSYLLPMNRPSARFATYRPLARRVVLLAGISLLLAVALIAYVYGTDNQFFSRLFGAFFVFFWLLTVTFLGAVPFVSWAAANWFGASWSDAAAPAATRPKRRPTSPASTRKTARTATRLNSTQRP